MVWGGGERAALRFSAHRTGRRAADRPAHPPAPGPSPSPSGDGRTAPDPAGRAAQLHCAQRIWPARSGAGGSSLGPGRGHSVPSIHSDKLTPPSDPQGQHHPQAMFGTCFGGKEVGGERGWEGPSSWLWSNPFPRCRPIHSPPHHSRLPSPYHLPTSRSTPPLAWATRGPGRWLPPPLTAALSVPEVRAGSRGGGTAAQHGQERVKSGPTCVPGRGPVAGPHGSPQRRPLVGARTCPHSRRPRGQVRPQPLGTLVPTGSRDTRRPGHSPRAHEMLATSRDLT